MSEPTEIKPKRNKILIALVVVALVIGGYTIKGLMPPVSELDKLVYAANEMKRLWFALQLARVVIITIICTALWKPVSRHLSNYMRVEHEVLLVNQNRIYAWYIAFEAMLLVTHIQ